jgi:nuclease S1
MKAGFVLAAALVTAVPSPVFAWGKTGHRVVAAIAEPQLSGLARAHVQEILGGGESLDEAANWPDEMRSDPAPFWQKTATPWHYVTLNGIIYDHAPAEGDALEALNHYRDVLRDPRATLAEKQTALRFIVHLVGDLHQPLHVGKCCDRGGNEVKVKWFGRDLNLHSVWDSALVDEEQLSFTEMAAKLDRHTSPQDVIDWWDINPRDWISESAQIRETIYPSAPTKPARPVKGKKRKGPALPELSYGYVYKFTPIMERRLQQAGVRLAAYLNDIYASSQTVSAR